MQLHTITLRKPLMINSLMVHLAHIAKFNFYN